MRYVLILLFVIGCASSKVKGVEEKVTEYNYPNQDLSLSVTNPNTRFIIKDTGNVGIGSLYKLSNGWYTTTPPPLNTSVNNDYYDRLEKEWDTKEIERIKELNYRKRLLIGRF